MNNLAKVCAILVAAAFFALDLKPVEAAALKPLAVETGYSDLIKVGRRRARRGRYRNGRRYRNGNRYRNGRRYRNSRRYRGGRRYRNRIYPTIGIGLGFGVGSGLVDVGLGFGGPAYGSGVYYADPVYTAPVYYERPRRTRRYRRAARSDAHVGWCTRRFRSYRVSDDTYQPYNGRRRRCNSPYD